MPFKTVIKLLYSAHGKNMEYVFSKACVELVVKVIEMSSPDHSWPYHAPGSYCPLV